MAINCSRCAVAVSKARLADVARIGRVAARSAEARAKHAATSRRQTSACWNWDASTQPDWLTAEFYDENIKPRLAKMSGFAIASRIGVSRWYAGRIRGAGGACGCFGGCVTQLKTSDVLTVSELPEIRY